MRWLLIFLLFPLLLCGDVMWKAEKQDCLVKIQISPSKTTLGGHIDLHASLIYPKNYQAHVQEAIDHLLWSINPLDPIWRIIEKEIEEPMDFSQDKLSQSFHIMLEPLLAGSAYLAFWSILFTPLNEEQTSVEIFTPSFAITITPFPEHFLQNEPLTPAPLFPLEPQFPMSLSITNRQKILGPQALAQEADRNQRIFRQQKFPWIILIGAALFSLSWLIWRQMKKRRSIAPPLAIDPKTKAIEHLTQLTSYPKKNERFYTQLTEVIRFYIEQRFQLPVRSKTTEEFLKEIQTHAPHASALQGLLKEFLVQADQIKFAHYEPTSTEAEKIYRLAEQIIEID